MDERLELVEAILKIASVDMDVWGTGGIGISLMRHYLLGEWVSAKALADSTKLSEAQVRRRLQDLKNRGLVLHHEKADRTQVFMASVEPAEDYLMVITELVSLQNAKPISYT
ncbi:MAG: hypothetical protein AAGF48_14940 [Pseudomonadota bacterium]